MAAPSNVGEGLQSFTQSLLERKQRQDAAFPKAPGGEKPGFGTGFMNLFTGGNNGGLW
jgi:hypothetical protein